MGERTGRAPPGMGPTGPTPPNTELEAVGDAAKVGSFGRSKPPVDPDTGDPINRPYTR